MNAKKLRRILFESISQQTIALRNDVFRSLMQLPLRQRIAVALRIIFKRLPQLPPSTPVI